MGDYGGSDRWWSWERREEGSWADCWQAPHSPCSCTALPPPLRRSCGGDFKCTAVLQEPFVELLKGSLNTFLNAFTYPDRTCYPVASANLQVGACTRVSIHVCRCGPLSQEGLFAPIPRRVYPHAQQCSNPSPCPSVYTPPPPSPGRRTFTTWWTYTWMRCCTPTA